MKFVDLSETAVKNANRQVYNQISIEEYDRNPSIFDRTRQAKIKETLCLLSQQNSRSRLGLSAEQAGSNIRQLDFEGDSGDRRTYFLDVGCGTGNVLKLAMTYFPIAIGVDQAVELLKKVKQRYPNLKLVAAEAQYLPFKKASFDCISYYGTLHHMIDPLRSLREGATVLKPKGYVYTDHDPNWFLGRFYHLYYQLRYKNRPGFGSVTAEIAEYHHTQTGGLNPEKIKQQFLELGFKRVNIYYRYTANPRLSCLWKMLIKTLSFIGCFIPNKNLFTHFSVIAQRQKG